MPSTVFDAFCKKIVANFLKMVYTYIVRAMPWRFLRQIPARDWKDYSLL